MISGCVCSCWFPCTGGAGPCGTFCSGWERSKLAWRELQSIGCFRMCTYHLHAIVDGTLQPAELQVQAFHRLQRAAMPCPDKVLPFDTGQPAAGRGVFMAR